MLFTDGYPARNEDLRIFESNINEVASVEGIDLDAKLEAAAEEIGDQIMAYLLQPGSGDPQASSRRWLGLTNLVVTPAMRRWHALHALAMTFRDAFHNQANERYRESWRNYVSAAAEARAVLFRIGLGFVTNPLPRPDKPYVEAGNGTWQPGVYVVRIAWVNAKGQVSAPSEPMAIELTEAGAPVVARPEKAPAEAVGWHVYVGAMGDDLRQQNVETLNLASPWLPTTGAPLNGEFPGSGQFADIYIAASRVTPRG
jgi:hypothetical protein